MLSTIRNIFDKPSSDFTPLNLAALNGQLSTVKSLISKGANVNCATFEGVTPLHLSAGNGHTDTVRVLLENGARVNCKDNMNITPMHLAAWGGHSDVVEYLFSRGGSIKSIADVFSSFYFAGFPLTKRVTPLDIAIRVEQYHATTTLLKLGSKFQSSHIKEILLTSDEFFWKMIEFFLHVEEPRRRFRPSTYEKFFRMAIKQMSLNYVKILVKEVDINNKDELGKTPLHHLVTRNNVFNHSFLSIMKVLLANGADPTVVSYHNETPFDVIISLNYLSVHNDTVSEAVHLFIETSYYCPDEMIKFIKAMEFKNELLHVLIYHFLISRPTEEKPAVLMKDGNPAAKSLSNYWDKCIAEIEKMKEIFFSPLFSLYHLFIEKDLNKVAHLTRNVQLMEFCASLEFEHNFNTYKYSILRKLKQGRQLDNYLSMLNKLQVSVEASGPTREVYLYPLCLLHIANYLTNDDLGNLIRAAIP